MKRFFGFSLEAAWPEELPPGKIVPVESRHLTLFFLGENAWEKELPIPPFLLAPGGVVKGLHFLKHVVAYDAIFFDSEVKRFADTFPQEREWMPHITISRTPDQREVWHFTPFPFYLKEFCLYETIAPMTYVKQYAVPFLPPFEEIAHTADIAFKIRGRNFTELYRHTALALAFRAPSFARLPWENEPSDLVEVVAGLNQLLFVLDIEEGSPMKAVSHAGHVEDKKTYLEWEMIVDV